MGFDVNKFQNAKFIERIESVKMEVLRDYFDPKEDPIFKVRNLTGEELGRVNQAVQKNKNVAAILDGLLSNIDRDKIEAIKQTIGTSDAKVPDDIARRLEMIQLGSVDPKVDLSLAKKLCRCFPIEFYDLTNAITRLTGLGSELGKAKPSGKTQK
ncbi:MAG: hypothetical protein ACFFDY_01290 [Candidatus Thorarchaeota archaeon]